MITLKFKNNLSFNASDNKFSIATNIEVLRYLKGIYTNKERFIDKFVKSYSKNKMLDNILQFFTEEYDNIEPYSFAEAFKIKNEEFKIIVFGSVNITDMIENLGHTRLSVKGKQVKRKSFSKEGKYIGIVEYDNIYEVHQVNGTKLGVSDNLYCVKCWCTSTNKEHWLWIEEAYKHCPLQAIASTFRFHSNIIPFIKEMKRQGDIMLIEMTKEVEPSGEIRPLTTDEYFNLLTSES